MSADPFAQINKVSVNNVDYWVDQLNDTEFNADAVAELFFATKTENEVSSTLGKITTLKENIEKILRSEVTSNYMTFIKARDTIKKTGLEISELRNLVDKTSSLIKDVRSNRLENSRTMRKNSMIGMISTIAHTPKLGYDGVQNIYDEQGLRRRSESYSGSSSDSDYNSDSSTYSSVESNDGNGNGDDDDDINLMLGGLDSWSSTKHDNKTHSHSHSHSHSHRSKRDRDKAVADLLEEYSSSADPNAIPEWLIRAPDELTHLIIEKSYHSAVKIVNKVRDYMCAWKIQYTREKEAYKDAKEQKLDEQALGLQGLSRDERKAAVNKQNKVKEVFESIEAKQLHLAYTLKDSVINLPHSAIWGVEEQRKRLKMLISLGHYAIAAEAFSKSRTDIIHLVLRDVEASGDPKIYIADISKGFYVGMLDVTITFLNLFARHAHIPSIMSILVIWCQTQTSSLVDILMQQIRIAAKEYAALAIIHMKPKADFSSNDEINDDNANDNDNTIDKQGNQGELISLTQTEGQEEGQESGSYSDYHKIGGPLKFTRECLNIVFHHAIELNQTGLQSFADLSWLLLPQLKKLVNTYSEDLIKETINQVQLDSWVGYKPRMTSIQLPNSILNRFDMDNNDIIPPATELCNLGSSFDWLTVAVTHFLDDVWNLLRIENPKFKKNKNKDSVVEETQTQGKEQRPEGSESSGESLYEDNSNSSTDDDEVDENNNIKYRSPTYRRMNFSEIEPIVVTCILRIITHYTMELSLIDYETPLFLNDEIKTKCLLDTCIILRETTIPSILKFIETTFFNLHMCHVRSSGVDSSLTPAPNLVLAESMKKLMQIESGIKLSMDL
jgi:hypothetical protein